MLPPKFTELNSLFLIEFSCFIGVSSKNLTCFSNLSGKDISDIVKGVAKGIAKGKIKPSTIGKLLKGLGLGDKVGKLYDNSVGDFLGEENGFYQITSGNVEGYVSKDYIIK